MQITQKTRREAQLATVVFLLLLLVVVGLLQWLTNSYHWRFDWTQSGRNTLSQASIIAVKRLQGPIKVTAFVSGFGDRRHYVRNRFQPYQSENGKLQLEFVDPDTDPDRVTRASIRRGSEILIRYKQATVSLALTRLNEENITNAFVRLGHRGERWLVFLAGHGERRIDKGDGGDLSAWADTLSKRGFKTITLFLNERPQIPRNTAVLIIASPKKPLLRRESRLIRKYLEQGGNLLWLTEPGQRRGLDAVAEYLGIEFQPGTVVDFNSMAITGNPKHITISQYGRHPVIRGFRERTQFFNARALAIQETNRWQSSPLLETGNATWSEVGPLSGKIRFNRGQDIPGPLQLAVSLSRPYEDRSQRVVVSGDGDFLSNRFLMLGYNLDLGMSMINWLSRDDDYVNIPVKIGVDRNLNLSRFWRSTLAALFTLVIPLGLIGTGITIWLRRRRR